MSAAAEKPQGLALYSRFALAGAICCSITHGALTPVDVVKTRIQLDPATYNKGLIGGFRQIVAKDGAGALLTGFGPTAAGYFLQGALKFGGYEFFKQKWIDALGFDTAVQNRGAIYIASSATAEFFADIALCPLEATRIRLVSGGGGGIDGARAAACEIVAWRIVGGLSLREAVGVCLVEIEEEGTEEVEVEGDRVDGEVDETTSLIPQHHVSRPVGSTRKKSQLVTALSHLTMGTFDLSADDVDDPTTPFIGLNALEIAAVSESKKFLAHPSVQALINGIWKGEIIFWDRVSINSVKKARFYDESTDDGFARLRVPKYVKAWEVCFFAGFLALYYAVMVQRDLEGVSQTEGLLYIWIAAFLCDEVAAWADAGSIFYTSDVWNIFDMCMILIAVLFVILRTTGLFFNNPDLISLSFRLLAVESLFTVPRIFSILSLSPYWGSIIPSIRAMARDFCKFMVFVVIVYLGFLTTFGQLARDVYSLPHTTMLLTKIFFGNSGAGFESMDDIDPIFGPPLMFVFVIFSNFLLLGCLTGMLSNTFSRVIAHADEEYLYLYSIYVLEASTSNRLTHFLPPFNLLAVFLFRPISFFITGHLRVRAARIALFKATHWPVVLIIKLYESIWAPVISRDTKALTGPPPVRSEQNNLKRPSSAQGPSKSLQVPDASATEIQHLREVIAEQDRKIDLILELLRAKEA